MADIGTRTVSLKKHIVCYDLLRIFASFLVVLIHTCFISWSKMPVTSIGWQTLNAYDGLAHCAVPLFVMISGTVFLRREKPIEPKAILTKYAPKLFVTFLFWSLLYAVFETGFQSAFSLQWIKTLIINCLNYKYHLWFFPGMIVAYLFLPLLWPLAHYKDGKLVGYACLLFLVLKVGLSTVSLLPVPDSLSTWMGKFSVGTANFVGYMLLGYYLSTVQKKKPAIWLTVLVLIISSLLIVILNSVLSVRAGKAVDKLFSIGKLPVAIQAAALFSLVTRLEQNERLARCGKTVTELADFTLGIYVVHIFVLEALRDWLHFSAHTVSLPVLISVPLIALIVFLISLAITAVLKMLPVVKDWLV